MESKSISNFYRWIQNSDGISRDLFQYSQSGKS